MLLVTVRFNVNVFRLRRAVRKCHVLQFALAAGIAHRAIQWMIPQQQLDHALARLSNLVTVGDHNHAVCDTRRAGSLQFRHLLNPHQTHAACALEGEIRVIAERRHFDPGCLTGFDQQSAGGSGQGFAVHCDVYEFGRISHEIQLLALSR